MVVVVLASCAGALLGRNGGGQIASPEQRIKNRASPRQENNVRRVRLHALYDVCVVCARVMMRVGCCGQVGGGRLRVCCVVWEARLYAVRARLTLRNVRDIMRAIAALASGVPWCDCRREEAEWSGSDQR